MQANGLSFEYNKIQPKMTILCPIHYVTIPLKTSRRWGNFPTVCTVVNSNNVISKRGRTSKQLTIHTELENYRNGEAAVDNFLIIMMLVSSLT